MTDGQGPCFTEYLCDIQAEAGQENFGIASCTWPVSGPLFLHKAEIIAHWNFRYKYREIGGETREKFQYNVDELFNNLIKKYDHKFAVFDAILSDSDHPERAVNTGKQTDVDSYEDTPGTSLSSTYLTNKRTVESTQQSGTYLNTASKVADGMRDIIDEYVEEYHDCFFDILAV